MALFIASDWFIEDGSHVLTALRQEALSGHAHTTMLATVSPSSDNYSETMSTLKYAERLRRASAHRYWSRDASESNVGTGKVMCHPRLSSVARLYHRVVHNVLRSSRTAAQEFPHHLG